MTKKRRSNQRGAAIVEFVLVLPLLILILFGIVEFSVMLYDNAVITNASREAAREWIEYRDAPTKALFTSTQLDNIVQDYCRDRLITFGASTTPTTTSTPSDPSSYTSGQLLTVDVSYQYEFLLIPVFVRNLLPTMTLTAQTVMRAE